MAAGVLSFVSLFGIWLPQNWPEEHHGHASHGAHGAHDQGAGDHKHSEKGHGEKGHGDKKHDGVKHDKKEHAEPQGDNKPPEGAAKPEKTESAKPESAKPESAKPESAKPESGEKPEKPETDGDGIAGESSDGKPEDGRQEDGRQEDGRQEDGEEEEEHVKALTGTYWKLGQFGRLQLTISYYIDSLTLCMFCMVTLIASCIHFYASGYMHDEESDVTDHEVTMSDGSHLTRPGRFHRFFQALSLFCFSMLGLVLAGNIAMVFVFWELVGICSYFLIGFYVERHSASTAANKAFIVNRVGDFGMIIGLMALWAGAGTFAFGDIDVNGDGKIADTAEVKEIGMFSEVRPATDDPHTSHQLRVPDGMVVASAEDEINKRLATKLTGDETQEQIDELVAAEVVTLRAEAKEQGAAVPGYWLLIIGGVGIFCGCVGKSAQFPLHVWLPDAMEGPTPVSALVHSATMVAAGVYLVGRFFPVFTPEVLLVIAIIGTITLFMAATIAITATDIKRVLAYSTISQLGYMMMSLGVGGWQAGLLHLITHAFFKSLLFMCSGSVIHAVHTNEMPEMGGLWKKMPYTAFTMLVGCLAIAGASIPFVVGMSGYYSKDAILEQSFFFMRNNQAGLGAMFFLAGAGGAAITAFYMFRLWFLTFAGEPRNQHRYDHAHESPKVMYVPLLVLSVFAIGVAWSTVQLLVVLLAGLAFAGVYWALSMGAGEGNSIWNRVIPAGGVALIVMLLANGLIGKTYYHDLTVMNLLEQSRPEGTAVNSFTTGQVTSMQWPNEHTIHEKSMFNSVKLPVTLLAFATGIVGIGLAATFYWFRLLDAEDTRRSFSPVYHFLLNKWWFDELYEWMFVKPSHWIGAVVSGFDRNCLDWLIDTLAWLARQIASIWDMLADRLVVDGFVNLIAGWTKQLGESLRVLQTGHLRQYVMFIVVGSLFLFGLISFF